MAVNKNFVVKNGLEVDTDLIFADASTNKVGIGSTIPTNELDIIGGIGATNIHLTGVGTIPTIKGTTGIVTTVVAHNAQVGNLNITGVTTIPSLGTLSELYISGVATVNSLDVITTANIPTGIVTRATGTHLNYSGVSTVGNFIITPDAVGTGATVGAAVGVITYYGDGVNLTNISSGIGIGSTGSDGLGASGLVGYGFTFLSFVGTGVSDVLFNESVGIATIWIAGGGGGSGNVSIGSEAPTSPTSGDLWYSTEYGTTFIWFDEVALGIGNTAVWVNSAPFNQGGKFLSKYGDNAYGAIGYTGGTTAQASIYFTGDPNTGLIQPAADHVNIVAGGVKSLEVNPTGISVVGVITGDGSGLTGVASTDNIITTKEAKLLGGVRMEGFTTSATMNVTGVSTFRGDITLTGSQAGVTSVFWDASADTLQFQDNGYLKLGAGGDLSLYHNGSNSYLLDEGTGSLFIGGSVVKITNAAGSETCLNATQNGAVSLYYDNSSKIETLSVGSTVSGIQYATSFSGAFGSWTLGASGTDHYTFDGPGLTGAESDPEIYLQRGKRYNFVNSSGGHPFRIQSDPNGSAGTAYNDGVTNNDAGDGTTLEWDVQFDAPDILYYQCTSHGNMGGKIYIGNSGDSANIANVIFTKDAVGTGATVGCAVGVATFIGDGSQLTGIAAGGSGQFNTSISGATQYDVTTSMATAYTASATATIRTVVHSIHICNITGSEASISGEMQTNFSFAHTIPVPAGSAVELLKQPKVLGPSETIELQSDTSSALEATIIVEEKEDTALWDAQIALSSAATDTDLYTSSSYPSVVQSILLCNNDGTNDVKARVYWSDGSNNVQSYLVYDMVVPADSTIEICEQPKYLATGYKLRAYANQADRLEITASGSQIVS